MNCWEFKKCGRQPGGAKVPELGICPAASETKAQGLNGGFNGGRSCWVITGTFCGGKVQGAFAMKMASCTTCDFYKRVLEEEGAGFMKSKQLIEKLK
jgi:hypothetical protein